MREVAVQATGVVLPTFDVVGKTLRSSYDRGKKLAALQSVSIWASELGLTLAQAATEEKSNEITVIPRALALVDLKGAIVSIDAMGAQTAIAQQIVEGKRDFILALKGNQGTLSDAAVDYLEQQASNDFRDIGARRLETTEEAHGRTETRTYIQMPVPKGLKGEDRWHGLMSLGVAILYCIRDGKETHEARYFVSSLPMKVKRFARAARNHWGIESTYHWCLDIMY